MMTKHHERLALVDGVIALILTAAALIVYVVSLTPSLTYRSPDGNELATIPYMLGLAHMPGYPLYTWIGKAFTFLPIGDVAHRMNLMSASMGAIGVGFLYLIIVYLLPANGGSSIWRRAAAASAALAFAFSPTFWSQAVITEVYAPNICMIGLTLLALLLWERTRKDFHWFLFALIFGLSLGTHLSNLGFAPAFALYLLLCVPESLKRSRWWLAGVIGFGLGAAQYLWLPLKAATLNDRLMLAANPTTVQGFYNYTLGAFSQFKFAFKLAELPDRLVVYLYLLKQQFGLAGLAAGMLGLASLLLLRPRHYFLLLGMYLLHVWFFMQYRVFDLDVFFLPAHFLWSTFLAFGVFTLLKLIEHGFERLTHRKPPGVGRWAVAGLALTVALSSAWQNFAACDRSHDVAVNDFYANVWEMLPADSALLTPSGVFGYDAFYWRLVYDTRPDVLLPALSTPTPSGLDIQGRARYSSTPISERQRLRGPGALPADLLTGEIWQVPILLGVEGDGGGFGRRGRLVLHALQDTPPEQIVPTAEPETEIGILYDGLTLVGVDLEPSSVESGGRLHLTLYWKAEQAAAIQVQTALGDSPFESHPLGLGNLSRDRETSRALSEGFLREEYWVVVPSTTEPGLHPLAIQWGSMVDSIPLGEVNVVDEEGTMERWIRIAG